MSNINVELLDFMGDDLDVVDAARVSFNKTSEWDDDGDYLSLKPADESLIKYLASHNHWSPFSHCYVKFRIKAPIFVARQLQKHTVGLAWNEVSRRYVDVEPEFYRPDSWRLRAENVKQGSSDEIHEDSEMFNGNLEHLIGFALGSYEGLLLRGVCPEQARMVLPQSMMTEWIWSGSLFAFARVCRLRLDPHSQLETRMVAEQIADLMELQWPTSWKALMV